MLDNIPILSLILFSPLLGVLILAFIRGSHGQWIKMVAIAATLIPLLLAGWLYADFDHQYGGMQYVEDLDWIEVPLSKDSPELSTVSSYFFKFSYKLGIDGMSLALVFLTALISSMAALAATHIKKRWKTFYILFLLLEIGMLGVFMARDLFLFFVFFEVTLVTVFFLVGIWGFKNREKAANQFLIYNGLGSAVMLIAFLILVNTAGFSEVITETGASLYYSGDVDVISANLQAADSYANLTPDIFPGNPFLISDTLQWGLFLMMLIAFGIKLPIFPLHTWMLKVHMEATPSVIMIHSGILLKMGAYGLIRYGVLLFPEQAKSAAIFLAVLGLINIIYGAILALRQKDFRLILAYSSISHMGIVLLGIAAFNQIGMQGAIFQMISHGLISALMFLIVGSLYERTSTMLIDRMGGLAQKIPFISGVLLFAGLAALGLPGLSGFIAEFLSFLGLFETMPIMGAIGMLGIILAAVYVLRGVLRITYGRMGASLNDTIKDARLIEAIPMITLVAFIILLGVYPTVLNEPLRHTVDSMISNFAMKMGG